MRVQELDARASSKGRRAQCAERDFKAKNANTKRPASGLRVGVSRGNFWFSPHGVFDLPNPLENKLLAMLPAAEFAQLEKHSSTVELRRGETLALPDQKIRRVYFPQSGIVSFVVELANGEAVQTGMIGRDGVVGAAQALDDKVSLNKIVVQAPGTASVIDSDTLLEILANPRRY